MAIEYSHVNSLSLLQETPYAIAFAIVMLIFLCFFLIVPVVGVIISLVVFGLTLGRGRYYWNVVGLRSDWTLIVVIVVLMAYALLYFVIAIKKKEDKTYYYFLLIQSACYLLPMATLIFTLWDEYVAGPSKAEILSMVFKVVILTIIGVIFAIPLVGSITAVITFVFFLIATPLSGGDTFFLTGLVFVLIVCVALYLYLIVRSEKWATRWWILIHIGCLMLPAIALITSLWGGVVAILYSIFFALGVISLLIALKKLKKF